MGFILLKNYRITIISTVHTNGDMRRVIERKSDATREKKEVIKNNK